MLNLLVANDLAWCDRPVSEQPAYAVPTLRISEPDPAAPAAARAVAPEEPGQTGRLRPDHTRPDLAAGRDRQMGRIDRWSMSQLTEAVAVSLFTKETGRPRPRQPRPSGAIVLRPATRRIEMRPSLCPDVLYPHSGEWTLPSSDWRLRAHLKNPFLTACRRVARSASRCRPAPALLGEVEGRAVRCRPGCSDRRPSPGGASPFPRGSALAAQCSGVLCGILQ